MFSNKKVDFNKKPCDNDVVVITTNKSSPAAEFAALSDRLGPHGSVQVSTLSLDPCGPNRSDKAASSAADDLLSLPHNFFQQNLNSGSLQVQILLIACQRSAMVRISDSPDWK